MEREALHAIGVPRQLQRARAVQDEPLHGVGVLVRLGLVRRGLRRLYGEGLQRQEGQRRR